MKFGIVKVCMVKECKKSFIKRANKKNTNSEYNTINNGIKYQL